MKNIFQKNLQLKAPGGNIYEWKSAETKFQVSRKGLYAIKIKASAKNAKQNNSTDDDDLKMVLDGFDFGKYENHQEKISWKGFGTSASWNGASLRGGIKTIHYFVTLEKGDHILRFFADNTPTLESIEVFEIEENNFELNNLKPSENIKSESKGIPWLSFVFLGSYTKSFVLGVNTKSAKTKGGTDGDNLKVVVNGKIWNNEQAQTSKKYKNFYFSGDLKEFDILTITNEDISNPIAFENAIELWYDEEPEISSLNILFFDNQEFLASIRSMVDLKSYIINIVNTIIAYFEVFNKPFSAQFIRHAIEDNPSPLIFHPNNALVKLIKKNPSYIKILEKLQEKIANGILKGEIWPKDFEHDETMKGQINFDSPDLATSLHGIKKIEYNAKSSGNNKFEVKFILFDIYDFQKEDTPSFLSGQFIKQSIINELDKGEDLGIIHNFEIEIHLNQTIYVH
ncbi:hypothetical protein KJ951_01750 [Patescibacteria group bacterium]|nr:hypothetical protein [Patescibacteria group bacterium]